jgi:RyR domain
MATEYKPKPIRADHIELNGELLDLVELLSENAHEVWARQRIDDGWTFGTARCDETRQHPCLIPYSSLPESEKVYDRNAVIGTVRAVLALGFVISKDLPTNGVPKTKKVQVTAPFTRRHPPPAKS